MTTDITSIAATRPEPSLASRILRAPFEGRTWRETLHLVLNLPFGVASFTLIVTGISLGFGLLITLLGIPILAATLFVSRAIAGIERRRAALLLEEDVPVPYRPDPPDRWWRVLLARFRDPATWLSALYDLTLLPLGTVTFAVTVTLWTSAIAAATLPLYHWALDEPAEAWFWGGEWRGGLDGPAGIAVVTVVGIVLLFATPWVIRGMAAVNRAILAGLLGGGVAKELSARLQRVSASRDAAVDVAAADRRKIERDLHDGVQQRLVSLAMDLGRAKEKLDSDPGGARELVSDAHEEAKRALVDIRNVARGVYPAVLTDRGLDAALSSLAARSTVPVEVAVEVEVRPPASVEAAAYFVVSEALANVAKHSRARRATVSVRRSGDNLTIQVQDDGVGGADTAKGSGLAGLRDRVQAIDGELHLLSPDGGPTVLMVVLPCAS